MTKYGSCGVVLGAGVTGLATGYASGYPVYEAAEVPGGICASYYIRPGSTERLYAAPDDGEAYRFEIGGGHWIFGGDPVVLRFISDRVALRTYERRSSVYLPEKQSFVPYPIQNHLRILDPQIAEAALAEMIEGQRSGVAIRTMEEWLNRSFGPTLGRVFFNPFHDLYTAGLYRRIAPQDSYKSPVDIRIVLRGAFQDAPAVGYNVTYVYPRSGLDQLARSIADDTNVTYSRTAVRIDPGAKVVGFEDGSEDGYDVLVSTLPLTETIRLAGLEVPGEPEPHSSVLVANIGGKKGNRCPEEHWLYVPETQSGFHRVGFYSNVDASFLPASSRAVKDRVSIYVESAFSTERPGDPTEGAARCERICKELVRWGWLEEPEVADPTWIEVAYTWSWPGSDWKARAMRALEEQDIYSVGRYARWSFQGIAGSLRDGLSTGAALREG